MTHEKRKGCVLRSDHAWSSQCQGTEDGMKVLMEADEDELKWFEWNIIEVVKDEKEMFERNRVDEIQDWINCNGFALMKLKGFSF
jgi:hypothetical protein